MNKNVWRLIFTLMSVLIYACQGTQKPAESVIEESKPSISFTFDDGITYGILDYPFEEWNEMILSHLDSGHTKAIFFVTGFNKLDKKGQYLLQTWDERGHGIANHTYTHPNFNSDKVSLADFCEELADTDKVISGYKNHVKMFRFPYLKEGNTAEKVEGFRAYCDSMGYSNGYVTIDASDWYINSRLIKRLKEDSEADISGFRDFYLAHIWERAQYYEGLSASLNDRDIPHTLLLHHNLTSALFLGDLIEMFQSKGWDVKDAAEAYQDDIFKRDPDIVPAGESLIWALAKESGAYEELLRYPAEDSRYEEAKMDSLGL